VTLGNTPEHSPALTTRPRSVLRAAKRKLSRTGKAAVARRPIVGPCVTPSDPDAKQPVTRLNRYLPNTREEEFAFKWLLQFYSAKAILLCMYYVQKEKEFQQQLDRESRGE
jgi:hypothetical protein